MAIWKKLSRRQAAALMVGTALSFSLAGAASATEGQLRIAKQFGVVYLLLDVAAEQKLIEKHGKAAGVDILRDPEGNGPGYASVYHV